MNTKILVCLDGSKLAEAILPYVADSCSRPDTELELVQVVPSQVTIPPPQSMHTMTFGRETRPGKTAASDLGSTSLPEAGLEAELKEIEREQSRAKNYLEGLAGKLRKQGLKVTTLILEGDARDKILSHIQKGKIAVVALSTHGEGGMERGLLGGVTQHILKESPVPVLLIKPRGKAVKKEEEY